MSIITIANFDGSVNNIPNTDKDYVSEQVGSFIATFEPDYLKKIMGYELFKLLLAAADGDERFDNLLTGCEFTYSGELMKWGGLSGDESPIADYVMYKYLTISDTRTSGTGEVKAKNVNAERLSPANRVMNCWNAMVEKNKTLHFLLESGDYPEYKGIRELSLFKSFNVFGIQI